MEPGLSKSFGIGGSWKEIVALRLGLGDDLPAHLRSMWQMNENAGHGQKRLSPEEFARYVADVNFSDIA